MTLHDELVATGKFSVNERQKDYEVTFRVSGSIHLTIQADSVEDARAKANGMTEDDEFGLELDEADDVSVGSVRKSAPMYRVTRDGAKMQVSRLDASDAPREPDERGF